MTVYRPQNALARWRNLTVIVAHAHLAAVGVDHTMSATHLALARAMAKAFAGTILTMSAGKCFIQNLVIEYPGTWTAGELFIPGDPAQGYVLRNPSINPSLLSIGINPEAFDSVSVITHQAPFGSALGGLANYDNTINQTSAHSLLLDAWTTLADVPVLMTHEWLHGACYFYFLRGAPAYLDLDSPANYRYLDNSAIPNSGYYREFQAGVMTGNVEDIATGTQQEITDTHWAYGTPRKLFP